MGLKPTTVQSVPVPAGTHVAVCTQVIDLGIQENKRFASRSHKIMFGWQIPDVRDKDGNPRMIWQEYTNSLGAKANLRRDVEAWLGAKLSPEHIKNFDPVKLIGRGCYLSVVHNDSDNGKTYANIGSLMPLPKGTPTPKPVGKTIVFDIDNWDQDVYDTFSEYLRKKIDEGRRNKDDDTAGDTDDGHGDGDGDQTAGAGIPEDDIPFSPGYHRAMP